MFILFSPCSMKNQEVYFVFRLIFVPAPQFKFYMLEKSEQPQLFIVFYSYIYFIQVIMKSLHMMILAGVGNRKCIASLKNI